jgi:hypothetical protein
MKTTVTDRENVPRVVSRLCNKCGVSMKRGSTYDSGLCDVVLLGNPDSTYLSNRTRYSFDLCEPCLVLLMDSFLLPPQVRKDGASVTYQGDRECFRAERREEARSQELLRRLSRDASDGVIPAAFEDEEDPA